MPMPVYVSPLPSFWTFPFPFLHFIFLLHSEEAAALRWAKVVVQGGGGWKFGPVTTYKINFKGFKNLLG